MKRWGVVVAVIGALLASVGASAAPAHALLPPHQVVVDLADQSVPADGESVIQATATVTDALGGPVPDAEVVWADSAGLARGPSATDGRGHYVQTFYASRTPGTVTLTATATALHGLVPVSASGSAEVELRKLTAASAAQTLVPDTLPADGVSTAVATLTLKDRFGDPVAGADVVAFVYGDATAGEAVDNGDGTYTAVVTASTTSGHEWVIMLDQSSGTHGQSDLIERPGPPADVAVSLDPSTVKADGADTSIVTALVTDRFGNGVDDAAVSFHTDGDVQFGPVVRTPAPGSYQSVVTASRSGGVEQVYAVAQRDGVSSGGVAALTERGGGYWVADDDGGVYAYAPFFGAASAPTVAIASAPDNRGYWMLGPDGSVRAFGSAHDFGSLAGQALTAPAVAIQPTPTGRGYWVALADAAVFGFGDAPDIGYHGHLNLASPIVGMAGRPTGRGFWLVAADGGVFSFGDAPFRGSVGGMGYSVAGILATSSGDGYWMATTGGEVLTFGDAIDYGSASSPSAAIISMAGVADGEGYRLLGADGRVYSLGSAVDLGSLPGAQLEHPVVGIAGF
jgi:hypothetical protein